MDTLLGEDATAFDNFNFNLDFDAPGNEILQPELRVEEGVTWDPYSIPKSLLIGAKTEENHDGHFWPPQAFDRANTSRLSQLRDDARRR